MIAFILGLIVLSAPNEIFGGRIFDGPKVKSWDAFAGVGSHVELMVDANNRRFLQSFCGSTLVTARFVYIN